MHGSLPVAGFSDQLKITIDIEDIYVPLYGVINLRGIDDYSFYSSVDSDKKLRDLDAGLDISLYEAFKQAEKRKMKHMIILGDPGSGKTTHLKRLLLACIKKGPATISLPAETIPVFLPLRNLKGLTHGLDAFIEKELSSPHLKAAPDFGERLLKRGNLLFILDGLDEIADVKEREKVSKWIDDALVHYPTCRFIVTCRFAGYSPSVRLKEKFLEMHIRPFNEDQVRNFIHNWYRIVEKGLARDPEQAEVILHMKSPNTL